MDVFSAPPGSLAFWQRLLFICVGLLGVEAPCLLVVAVARRQSWGACLLALAPLAGFAWGVYLAYSVRVALGPWQSDIIFQQAHYPARYWPTLAREQPASVRMALESLRTQTAALGWLTLALLIMGWLLLRRWLRHRPLGFPAPVARRSPDEAPPPEEELGLLEITAEPLEREGGP